MDARREDRGAQLTEDQKRTRIDELWRAVGICDKKHEKLQYKINNREIKLEDIAQGVGTRSGGPRYRAEIRQWRTEQREIVDERIGYLSELFSLRDSMNAPANSSEQGVTPAPSSETPSAQKS